MEISRMLLKKKMSSLRKDFEDLYAQIKLSDYEESQELKIVVHVKLQEAEMLDLTLEHVENVAGTLKKITYEENIRQLKHDYHSAERKWKHIKSLHDRHEAVAA
ncbi:MAG TPA: hypothetical protein VL688_12250 [Verrucomicrobiae bacterium]|jgi:hypothetical protein|nr:hypothetical protein [Verrucomicrobiae bacterium]